MFVNDDQLSSYDARHHVDLLLQIARAYYLDSQTQSQIAQQYGYSRPTITRFLKEARARGMVHITVNHPLERLQALETQLISRYGLRDARVAEPQLGENPINVVPRYAAALLIEHMKPNSMVTVSNGNAVAATVRETPFKTWPRTNVSQMIGTLSPKNSMTDSPEICRMLSQRLGGSFTPLPVPMILSSASIAKAMKNEKQISTVLALDGAADIALVGVGAVANMKSGHIFDSYIDPPIAHEIAGKNAIGHICGHTFLQMAIMYIPAYAIERFL